MTLLATLASSVVPTAVSAAETIVKENVEEVQIKDNLSAKQENSIVESENSESTTIKSNEKNQEATSESIHSEIVESQSEEKIEESSSSKMDSPSIDSSESKESKQKIVEEKPATNEESTTTKSSVETFKADGNDVVTKSEYVHFAAVITTADQPVFSEPGYTVGAKKIGETTTYLNQQIIILQEKVTGKGIWAQISINNKIMGWVAKNTLTVIYDKIIEKKWFITMQSSRKDATVSIQYLDIQKETFF